MRPVKLTVAGMRSYRAQRTLDFTDRTLMAILGDTGSGKSSLLEALYGALYGGSTWDARGLGALIADGVQTLQIELEFRARGNTYTVSRSTSRRNYPPSKHVFDGPGGEHLDGEKDVNRRIVELVGLTAQEFLRVVILPQGRFGQLLQGTSGERIPILRGILGLGVLDRIRDVADRQAASLGAALEPIVAARARLYPNPRAIAETAATASNEQATEVQQLEATSKALQDLAAATKAVSGARLALTTALEPAAAIDLTPDLSDLAAADAADTQIATQDKDLATQIAELDIQEKELKLKITAAAEAGFTHSGLAKMSAALTSVGTELPALAQQATRNVQEQDRLTAQRTQLAANAEAVQTSAATAEAHKLSLAGLATDAENAREQARQQAERISAIGVALSDLRTQEDRLAVAVDAVLSATQEVHRARSETAAATTALSLATSELAALREANAAAHLAREHAPGQPCPVCRQTLPAGFAPPEIGGEQGLVERLEAAQQRQATASSLERSRDRAADAEHQKLVNLAGTSATAARSVTRLLDPGSTPGISDATEIAATVDRTVQRILDLAGDQAAALEKLTLEAAELTGSLRLLTGLDAAEKLASTPAVIPTMTEAEALRASAAQAFEAGQDRVQQLTSAAMRLDAEHRATVGALHRHQSDHKTAVERTAQAAKDLADVIRGLDPLVSEPLMTALNLTATDPGAALLKVQKLPAGLLTDLKGQLSTKQDWLEQLNDQRETVTTALRERGGQRSLLRDARVEAVDRPRASARRSWERASGTLQRLVCLLAPLQESWERLSRAVQAAPLPTLSADLPPFIDIDDVTDQQLRAEVASLQGRLEVAVSHVSGAVAAAWEALKLADLKEQALLTAADATTLDDLVEHLSQVRHELRDSIALHQRASAQIPLAKGLDIGVTELTRRLAVLRQVKDLLNPSAFPQFVVQQRQVALLKLASSLFGQLTRGGYGFGEDFMIVDRRTGQPRHPKTLSGGETFLASLALALALVEISNRSGGQLDCLFLDEGFGSLDSSILGEALDVLRLQSTGGRLVGVISHLHAVAAELDDVLLVTKEVEGSSFQWLNPQERDAFLLDEAAAGLLS